MIQKFARLCVVLAGAGVMALLPARVFAQTPQPPAQNITGDQLRISQDFTLRAGEVATGDIVLAAGNLALEEGSRVQGSVMVLGGAADIFGAISQDLTVIGGNAHMRATARVEGEVNVIGGALTRDPGAVVVGGANSALIPTPAPPKVPAPLATLVPQKDSANARNPFNFNFSWLATLASIAFATAIAVAITWIFPSNMTRITEAIWQHGALSGGVGLALFFAVFIFSLVCAITLCLIPFALLALVAWGLVALFGWSAVAHHVGGWLLKGFGAPGWTPIGKTALGALVLSALGQIPVLGVFVSIGAISLGAGALLLTRFGSASAKS